MTERYDLAIVGSGPAGLAAAINAKIRNKNIIVFGQAQLSQKLSKAPLINNYLGIHNIAGEDLKNQFQYHIQQMGISITQERVNAIYAMGEYFALMVNEKEYQANSVILATGIEFGKPLDGELEYLGRGVGYCATCDAPLYKGKTVTIIGSNEKAIEEANYVSELAKKVYYVPANQMVKGLNPNIEVIQDKPLKIEGDSILRQLILKEKVIMTDAVFILKDSIAPDQLVPGLALEGKHIAVNRKMATNLQGLFAAGDCVGEPYQYMKAAGEGQVAALEAVSYLAHKKISDGQSL